MSSLKSLMSLIQRFHLYLLRDFNTRVGDDSRLNCFRHFGTCEMNENGQSVGIMWPSQTMRSSTLGFITWYHGDTKVRSLASNGPIYHKKITTQKAAGCF